MKHNRNDSFSGRVLYSIRYRLIKYLSPIVMPIMSTFCHKRNKVVFSSFNGKGYQNTPKNVSDRLLSLVNDNGLNVDIVWIIKRENYRSELIPNGVRVVFSNTWKEIYELATAKIWVDDHRKYTNIRKAKKQLYLQMWHSNGPILKKVEKDAIACLPTAYIKRAKHDSGLADCFFSECEWRTQNIREAFWYSGEIVHCKSDTVKKGDAEIIRDLRKKYQISEDSQIALYAPTFRDNCEFDVYQMNFFLLQEALRERFGGQWVVLIRLHPKLSGKVDKSFWGNTIDVTDYPSFDNLLGCIDVLITDFSGTIFKALRNQITTFLYAKDFERYISKERELYFDLERLPAPFAFSEENLFQDIRDYNSEDYIAKSEEFNEKIGYYSDDLLSLTETVVEKIVTTLKMK